VAVSYERGTPVDECLDRSSARPDDQRQKQEAQIDRQRCEESRLQRKNEETHRQRYEKEGSPGIREGHSLATNLPGQWLQCQANGSNVCRVRRHSAPEVDLARGVAARELSLRGVPRVHRAHARECLRKGPSHVTEEGPICHVLGVEG